MLRMLKASAALITILLLNGSRVLAVDDEGWVSLFDGKSLAGWKVAENPKSFSVQDGQIVVHGDRAHMPRRREGKILGFSSCKNFGYWVFAPAALIA